MERIYVFFPHDEKVGAFSHSYLSCVEQIYVFFPNDEKVGVKHIKKYAELMKAENVPRAILVLQQNLTPFAKSYLQELSPKYHLEIFQVS